MPKIDLDAIEQVNRTGYPPPFDARSRGRWYRRLATASGLTDFGVSHVVAEARRLVVAASLARWRGRVPGHARGRSGAGRGRRADDPAAGRLRGLAQGQHQRPPFEQRERSGLRVHRRRRRHQHRRRLFRHRHDFHADGTYAHKDGTPYRSQTGRLRRPCRPHIARSPTARPAPCRSIPRRADATAPPSCRRRRSSARRRRR